MQSISHRATDPRRKPTRVPSASVTRPLLATHEMGDVLQSLGLSAEALDTSAAASRRHPDDALAVVGQGRALRSLDRYQGALEAYEQVIRQPASLRRPLQGLRAPVPPALLACRSARPAPGATSCLRLPRGRGAERRPDAAGGPKRCGAQAKRRHVSRQRTEAGTAVVT